MSVQGRVLAAERGKAFAGDEFQEHLNKVHVSSLMANNQQCEDRQGSLYLFSLDWNLCRKLLFPASCPQAPSRKTPGPHPQRTRGVMASTSYCIKFLRDQGVAGHILAARSFRGFLGKRKSDLPMRLVCWPGLGHDGAEQHVCLPFLHSRSCWDVTIFSAPGSVGCRTGVWIQEGAQAGDHHRQGAQEVQQEAGEYDGSDGEPDEPSAAGKAAGVQRHRSWRAPPWTHARGRQRRNVHVLQERQDAASPEVERGYTHTLSLISLDLCLSRKLAPHGGRFILGCLGMQIIKFLLSHEHFKSAFKRYSTLQDGRKVAFLSSR